MAAPSNRRSFYRQPMYLRINLRASGIRAPVPATLVDLSGGGGMVSARTMLKTQQAVEFDLAREGQPHGFGNGDIRRRARIGISGPAQALGLGFGELPLGEVGQFKVIEKEIDEIGKQ